MGGGVNAKSAEMALLWLLAYSDGEHSLADIAHLSQLPAEALDDAAGALVGAHLLTPA